MDPSPSASSLNLHQRQVASLREEALRCFDLADGESEAHFNRGLLFLELQDSAAACSEFEKAVAKKPTACDALINYGVALETLRKQAIAMIQYEACLRVNDRHAIAAFNFANVLCSGKKWIQAVQAFTLFIIRFGTPEQAESQLSSKYSTYAKNPGAGGVSIQTGVEKRSAQTIQGGRSDQNPGANRSHRNVDLFEEEDPLGHPALDKINEGLDLVKLVAFACHNRALCFQHLKHPDMAKEGYTMALQWMSGRIIATE